jgi:catalase
MLASLREAAGEQQVNIEVIAPAIGGIEVSDGSQVPADQKIGGGPSVLYDAVVILVSKDGAAQLASMPAASDFVTDAYAHCKFIGYTREAMPLLEASRLAAQADDGFVRMDQAGAAAFIGRCASLRFWRR